MTAKQKLGVLLLIIMSLFLVAIIASNQIGLWVKLGGLVLVGFWSGFAAWLTAGDK